MIQNIDMLFRDKDKLLNCLLNIMDIIGEDGSIKAQKIRLAILTTLNDIEKERNKNDR